MSSVVLTAAVEGTVDAAVANRLAHICGADLGIVHGQSGKGNLLKNLFGYNRAAAYSPWLVLIDLDEDELCPALARLQWLPSPSTKMCFRIAVREVETWLLADQSAIAEFLHVSPSAIPSDPEELRHPKREVVRLASSSRRKDIRRDMVPRPRSCRVVGPAYSSRMAEFALLHWRPSLAAAKSESLTRCIDGLQGLVTAEASGSN